MDDKFIFKYLTQKYNLIFERHAVICLMFKFKTFN